MLCGTSNLMNSNYDTVKCNSDLTMVLKQNTYQGKPSGRLSEFTTKTHLAYSIGNLFNSKHLQCYS